MSVAVTINFASLSASGAPPVLPKLNFLLPISGIRILFSHARGRNNEMRCHGQIALRMVRYQYYLCLIECGSSPADFVVFYAAHGVNDPSLLYLGNEVAS